MGTQIELNCNCCDIHDLYKIGQGFSGISYYLCACQTCGSLVMKAANAMEIVPHDRPTFTCDICKHPLDLLPNRDNDDKDHGERVEDYGPCPRCTGYLYAQFTGLCWD